jgi:hypothetical protein
VFGGGGSASTICRSANCAGGPEAVSTEEELPEAPVHAADARMANAVQIRPMALVKCISKLLLPVKIPQSGPAR